MANTAQHHCTRPWYMRPPVWILGIIAAALIIFGAVETASGPAATPYSAFLDQLDAGNIASVTFQGTQIDGRFKHPVANTASSSGAQQNVFRSRVPEFGDPTLLPELRKEHVAIDVVTSSAWMSWLGRLPWPMVVFLAFILIAGLVRLVRGKAASDSAMPMRAPMQGIIGLVLGLFGKRSESASESKPAGSQPKS